MADSDQSDGMPIAITLDPGIYFRCTCGKSQHLPFCDESHGGSGTVPLRFEIVTRQKVYLCGCGRTDNAPYCDGGCGFTPPPAR
jgi:CDGSH-type Zn-finger protein